jgi:hypothetical protein
MGYYYKIANLTKQQCFNAIIFNEGIRRGGIMRGIHAYALGKLLTLGGSLQEKNANDFSDNHSKWREDNPIGIWDRCWAGDQIAIVGEDDELALGFENIGGKMICWLVNDAYFAEWLLEQLRQRERYLANIGYIAYKYRHLSEELITFLDQHFPKSWEKIGKRIWEDPGNTFIEPDL